MTFESLTDKLGGAFKKDFRELLHKASLGEANEQEVTRLKGHFIAIERSIENDPRNLKYDITWREAVAYKKTKEAIIETYQDILGNGKKVKN